MTGRTVDALIYRMPAVAREAEAQWSRDFARSIMRQAKMPGWDPTHKQLAHMQRLVAELFNETNLEVIEE